MSLMNVVLALAELPPDEPNTYVAAALELIGSTIQCREGFAALSVRVVSTPQDPLKGFRMVNLWLAGPRTVTMPTFTDAIMANPELITQDAFFQEISAGNGAHRTYHPPDPRTVPGQENAFEGHMMNSIGACDTIKLVHNCSADVELIIGFHRFVGEPKFTDANERALQELNPGLASWARRMMVLFGYGPGMQPLTPRETQVAALLLGASAQKEHASRLDISQARAAEITREVHRKLGTGSRAELQRLWMSGAAAVDAKLPVTPRARKRSPKD